MTLGGMALAVGILVDDATVEIENIHRNLGMGKPIEQAILDGAAQIAIPAFVSTLCICIVFVPDVFPDRRGEVSVRSAGGWPWCSPCSRRICCRARWCRPWRKYLLQEHDDDEIERRQQSRNPLVRFQLGFEHYFERFRRGYRGLLQMCIEHSAVFLIFFLVFCIGSAVLLYPFLGQDFFPSVDAGQFKMHLRARTGTRIEETANLCDRGGSNNPRGDSKKRAGHHHRQYRPAV